MEPVASQGAEPADEQRAVWGDHPHLCLGSKPTSITPQSYGSGASSSLILQEANRAKLSPLPELEPGSPCEQPPGPGCTHSALDMTSEGMKQHLKPRSGGLLHPQGHLAPLLGQKTEVVLHAACLLHAKGLKPLPLVYCLSPALFNLQQAGPHTSAQLGAPLVSACLTNDLFHEQDC